MGHGVAVTRLQTAEQLCSATGFQQPAALDVLAAAYASAGRFPDAVETAQKAEELAHTFPELARQIQERLKTCIAKTVRIGKRPFQNNPFREDTHKKQGRAEARPCLIENLF
jgi:hypothetical protein